MKKLSLDALKAKANDVVSTDVMDKITGGNKNNCHVVHTYTTPDGAFTTQYFSDNTSITWSNH